MRRSLSTIQSNAHFAITYKITHSFEISLYALITSCISLTEQTFLRKRLIKTQQSVQQLSGEANKEITDVVQVSKWTPNFYIKRVDHRKRITKLTFWVLALRQMVKLLIFFILFTSYTSFSHFDIIFVVRM